MRFIKLTALFRGVWLLAGCMSRPANISDTVTPAELVQRAQEASDRNRYTLSLGYYELILERFRDDNEYACAAEYEIGFIHYKQKKYDIAETELRELLGKYDQSDAELLPPQYKILADIVIAKIDERNVKKPFSFKR
jgi:outer membrane protein assembly factor BamD (BamD/ComL family)